MEQEISSKLDELRKLLPENREFRVWLSESNLWSWLYSGFRIQGQAVSKSAVVDMYNGVIREDVPLSNYSFVQKYRALYLDMQTELSMRSAPDIKLFRRWLDMLYEGVVYRKNNPVVFEFGLIPCHFSSIEEELEKAFRAFVQSDKDPVEASAMLFLDIVKIYPFEEESIDAAMTVLLYCLEGFGFPIPELSVNEEEFGNLMRAYMDKGNAEPFCSMLERSVYNRLDAVIMLAKHTKENEEN